MIKKLFSLAAILCFAFGILFFSIQKSSIGAQPSLAVASIKFSADSENASVSANPQVNYSLPYPGLLPDNPLYKVKMVRDWLWSFLTTDPISRSELFLLYADKRVGAGQALVEGGQAHLGLSTILKGEKYLEKSVLEVEKAKKEGTDISSLLPKIQKACEGHQEILTNLKLKVNSDGQGQLDDYLNFLKNLQNKADNL